MRCERGSKHRSSQGIWKTRDIPTDFAFYEFLDIAINAFYIPSLKPTYPLKIGGWETTFPLGKAYFHGLC